MHNARVAKRPARTFAIALVFIAMAVTSYSFPFGPVLVWQGAGQQPGNPPNPTPPTILDENGTLPEAYPGAQVQNTDPNGAYYVDPTLPQADRQRLNAYIVTVSPDMSQNFIIVEHGQRVIATKPELYDTFHEVTLNPDGSYLEADGTRQGFPVEDPETTNEPTSPEVASEITHGS